MHDYGGNGRQRDGPMADGTERQLFCIARYTDGAGTRWLWAVERWVAPSAGPFDFAHGRLTRRPSLHKPSDLHFSGEPMKIRVVFFGVLKDLAGRPGETVDLPEGARVREVLSHYAREAPGIEAMAPSLAISVNREYSGADRVLREGDEVGLLPPVSGGSPEPGAVPHEGGITGEGRGEVRIVRELIDADAVARRLQRPPMARWRSSPAWCATAPAGGALSIWSMKPTRRWLCGRWNLWRRRRGHALGCAERRSSTDWGGSISGRRAC